MSAEPNQSGGNRRTLQYRPSCPGLLPGHASLSPVPDACLAPACTFALRATAGGQLNRESIKHFVHAHAELLTTSAPTHAIKSLLSGFWKRPCSAGRHIVASSTTGQCAPCRQDKTCNSSGVAHPSPRPRRETRTHGQPISLTQSSLQFPPPNTHASSPPSPAPASPSPPDPAPSAPFSPLSTPPPSTSFLPHVHSIFRSDAPMLRRITGDVRAVLSREFATLAGKAAYESCNDADSLTAERAWTKLFFFWFFLNRRGRLSVGLTSKGFYGKYSIFWGRGSSSSCGSRYWRAASNDTSPRTRSPLLMTRPRNHVKGSA